MLENMGARKNVVFEVWLPSLRHKWPCETYVPMNGRAKSLHGRSRTVKTTYAYSDPSK